jgi:hypothetical protein
MIIQHLRRTVQLHSFSWFGSAQRRREVASVSAVHYSMSAVWVVPLVPKSILPFSLVSTPGAGRILFFQGFLGLYPSVLVLARPDNGNNNSSHDSPPNAGTKVATPEVLDARVSCMNVFGPFWSTGGQQDKTMNQKPTN